MYKKLSPTIRLIIECCKIDKKEEIIIQSLKEIKDWKELDFTAHCHGVYPLVYNTLKSYPELIPSDILQTMKLKNLNIIKQNMMMSSELLNVLKILEKNNIVAIPFKGPVLSQIAYGDVVSRQYVDLDILVDKNDLKNVCNILNKYKYKYDEKIFNKIIENNSVFHDISLYKENTCFLEVHWRLLSDEYYTDFFKLDLNDYLDEYDFNNYKIKVFKNEFLFLYLTIHGIKHNWERTEWLVDIMNLINKSRIDFSLLYDLSKKTKTKKILFTTLILLKNIFDVELPNIVEKNISVDILKLSIELEKTFFDRFYFVVKNLNEGKNISKIQYKLLETHKGKSKFILALFKPTQLEYDLMTLPKSLNFIYFIIRPFNILYRKFKYQ